MVKLGHELADEIAKADDRPSEAVYHAKLTSVRRLQGKGLKDATIGRALGIRLDDADHLRIQLGSPDRLNLTIEWDRPTRRGRSARDVGGKLEIMLGREASGPRSGRRSAWRFSPAALLLRIAEGWRSLVLEGTSNNDKMDVGSLGALSLKDVLEPQSHTQLLTLTREGRQLNITDGRKEWTVDFLPALLALERLGQLLFNRLHDPNMPDVELDSWAMRDQVATEEAVSAASGTPDAPVLRHLIELLKSSNERFDFMNLVKEPPELVVLARMLPSGLSNQAMNGLLDMIDAVPKTPSSARLDELSRQALEVINSRSEQKHYRQGYELAAWLRGILSKSPDVRVDSEELLRSWDVAVSEDDFIKQVDAIAVWGPSHGPSVIVNKSGVHAQTRRGRRATVAHELCHVLIDRQTALPAVEVLGGRVSNRVEARARAFAAEFLAPRDSVAHIVRRSASIVTALEEAQEVYDVSVPLTAWQITNSGVALSARDRNLLRRLAEQVANIPPN